MSASDIIVIGIGPGSEIKTFLTFGLDIGAVVAISHRRGAVLVSGRDKRITAKVRDRRTITGVRDKRIEVEG